MQVVRLFSFFEVTEQGAVVCALVATVRMSSTATSCMIVALYVATPMHKLSYRPYVTGFMLISRLLYYRTR